MFVVKYTENVLQYDKASVLIFTAVVLPRKAISACVVSDVIFP